MQRNLPVRRHFIAHRSTEEEEQKMLNTKKLSENFAEPESGTNGILIELRCGKVKIANVNLHSKLS